MKQSTQNDVARVAGVSRATVSLVLNDVKNGAVTISDETRRRVWDAIRELDYIPDARGRAIRSGLTKTLGLIMPNIRNPHFCETVEGIEQEARTAGYSLLLSSMTLKYEYLNEVFINLLRRQVDGLIVMGTFAFVSDEANIHLNRFFKRHSPVVEICDQYIRENAHYEVDRMCSDYFAATKEAMAYLLSMNHRRIGMICGVASTDLGIDRLQAYEEYLQSAGLPVDEELIIRCGPDIEEGYQATMTLLSLRERPTAIVAMNDVLAIAALRAISDSGLKVPTDISLLGYDDIVVAKYLVPRLTTVSKDIASLGRAAVRLLLARLQEPDRPYQTERSPARLIIRESTGLAPS